MAQEYQVRQFNKGDFQDPHGNYWCDMSLEGVGEPVKIVVKDPMQFKDGMTLYGNITDETSKAGKPYSRFRREAKPDQQPFESSKPEAKKDDDKYWEDKNSAIKAQWAIGQAVKATEMKASIDGYFADVEHLAKEFYLMVDSVKASGVKESKVDEVFEPSDEDTEKPINLDDIPF